MTKEVETASIPVWQSLRITPRILALMTMFRMGPPRLDVPGCGERQLPNGCAFAVRYSSR